MHVIPSHHPSRTTSGMRHNHLCAAALVGCIVTILVSGIARPIPELAPVIKMGFMTSGAVPQDKVEHRDSEGKSTWSV